jgi:hypothetical protein
LRQQALQVDARAVPGNESVNREGSPQVMESRLMSRVAVIAQDTRTDTKPAKSPLSIASCYGIAAPGDEER